LTGKSSTAFRTSVTGRRICTRESSAILGEAFPALERNSIPLSSETKIGVVLVPALAMSILLAEKLHGLLLFLLSPFFFAALPISQILLVFLAEVPSVPCFSKVNTCRLGASG